MYCGNQYFYRKYGYTRIKVIIVIAIIIGIKVIARIMVINVVTDKTSKGRFILFCDFRKNTFVVIATMQFSFDITLRLFTKPYLYHACIIK